MGIWVVSDGEAMTVSVYDPKAVQKLDMTFLCGWWAELGIPPLKSMATSGLGGVAGKGKNARVCPSHIPEYGGKKQGLKILYMIPNRNGMEGGMSPNHL